MEGVGLNEIGMGVRFYLKDQFSRESDKIAGKMQKLENITRESASKITDGMNKMRTGFASLGVGVLIAAPFIAAAKQAVEFEKGMAKINTTAQLTREELNKLRDEILTIGASSTGDIMTLPDSFEKIISQTNDASLSMDIFKVAVKGAQAGFTDVNTVAGALAQTLSIVGKQNTTAAEVMDTLFAAKRLGAGEFKDFATYLPQLVAAGSNLNLKFQETAGIFSFFTAKGQDAASSAMLIQNAFSALQKTDIQKGLAKAGVAVFDLKGNVRGMTEIFGDLKTKLDSLTPEGKANFLDKIGLRDVQARNAFAIMTSDVNKLRESIEGTKNPTGELNEALKNGMNEAQKFEIARNELRASFLKLGDSMLPVVTIFTNILAKVVKAFTWLASSPFGKVLKGLLITTAALAIVIGLVNIHLGMTKFLAGKAALAFTEMGMAEVGAAFATGGLTAGFRALIPSIWGAVTASLAFIATPIGAVLAVIGLLVIGLVKAWTSFSDVMDGTAEPADGFLGQLQKIGGVMQGVVEIFRTWNGETFTLSKKMKESLEKMGILQLVLNIGTWIVRIKEFMKGFIEPAIKTFKELFGAIGEGFNAVWSVISDVLGMFGINIDKAVGKLETFKNAGRMAANILLAPFRAIAVVFKIIAWAIGTVRVAINFLIDSFKRLINLGGGVLDKILGLFGNKTNYGNTFDKPKDVPQSNTPELFQPRKQPGKTMNRQETFTPKQNTIYQPHINVQPALVQNTIMLDGRVIHQSDTNQKNLDANRR